MLGLTPDPLSAGVGMRVAVAGPYGHERVTAWQDGADAQRKNTAGGFRFVWPRTRAGRRPRPPVANDRLRYMRIGSARVSTADGSQSLDLQRVALQAAGVRADRSGARQLRARVPGGRRARRLETRPVEEHRDGHASEVGGAAVSRADARMHGRDAAEVGAVSAA